jgi:hypothetical protein
MGALPIVRFDQLDRQLLSISDVRRRWRERPGLVDTGPFDPDPLNDGYSITVRQHLPFT